MKKFPRLTRKCNAYEFFTEILPPVLREEPKSVRMAIWCATKGTPMFDRLVQGQIPRCGTVGCIGGWSDIMLGFSNGEIADKGIGDILRDAGLPSSDLFLPPWWVTETDQGTPQHVERVIAHMKAYSDRHRTTLETIILEPPNVNPRKRRSTDRT